MQTGPTTSKITNLGDDWFAHQRSDGSLTLRNSVAGKLIILPASSVATLKQILDEVADLPA